MTLIINQAIEEAEQIIEHQKNIVKTYAEIYESLYEKEVKKSVGNFLEKEEAVLEGMEMILSKIKGGL